MQYSITRRNRNKCLALIAIALMLLATLIVISILKAIVSRNTKKYPKAHNCNDIDALFPEKDNFLKYATLDKEQTLDGNGYGLY